MIVNLYDLKYGFAAISDTGSAFVQFRDTGGSTVHISSDEPYDLITLLRRAADEISNKLVDFEAEPEPTPPPHRLDARTRSVDIEDVTAGDQIRVGGWWHRVAEINERRHGVTVKTTRNEWFAFDHGDRVTVGIGVDNE